MTRRAVFAFAGLAAILHGRALYSFQQPAFRSGTLGVRVDVRVTDGRKPVAGLAAADFELRDNGVPQSLELIQISDLPLNVILALDVSGSTTGARQADLVAASEAALDGLKPGDRAGLTTFSHAVVPRVPLTADTAAVRAALQRLTHRGERPSWMPPVSRWRARSRSPAARSSSSAPTAPTSRAGFVPRR